MKQNYKIIIIQVYAPPEATEDEITNEFYQCLEATIQIQTKEAKEIMIM